MGACSRRCKETFLPTAVLVTLRRGVGRIGTGAQVIMLAADPVGIIAKVVR